MTKNYSVIFKTALMAVAVLAISCTTAKQTETPDEPTLKEAFKDKFLIGVATNTNHDSGKDTAGVRVIKQQFNSIVAENCMKSEVIQPKEGQFDFTKSDQFVKFGEENNMFIIGHTLIWHSQAPDWFFVDDKGKDVSKEVLIERMRNHISTLVSRYKGRVKGWDVVNEAFNDDGTWRESKFYTIIGEEYVSLAFQFAHEADPDAELYYNDYSMSHEAKCQGVVKMVKDLQAKGIKIDAIGMQGHSMMDFPTIDAFEKSLLAFASLNVKVMITEFDITVLPFPTKEGGAEVSMNVEYQQSLNPYANGLPEDMAQKLEARYLDFFKLFLKHQDKISRVTLWGVSDGDSWRNDWPVKGRTDYPLLFDRNHEPKPVVAKIIELAKDEKK